VVLIQSFNNSYIFKIACLFYRYINDVNDSDKKPIIYMSKVYQ
jgi:hypothetical protein